MPYYVHREDEDSTLGEVFQSRRDAYAHAETRNEGTADTPSRVKAIVSFVLSDAERNDWRLREYRKFSDGVYAPVPWMSVCSGWEPRDMENPSAPDQMYGVYLPVAFHFAHMSLKYPGQIAYTPSDEHGVQDRQTPIKPGKYLEQFLPGVYTAGQIAEFVAKVKASSQPFNLTTDPAEIERVYVNGHSSFRSCMSRPAHRYLSSMHPARAYGHSPDLALAYLGTVEHPTARCVVWPERKQFTRIYGDTTLRAALQMAGYTKDSHYDYGSLEGARIRAIEDQCAYVMPYVDAAYSADLSDCGKYLVLHMHTDGEFETHQTSERGGDVLPTGLTTPDDGDEDEDSESTCANCGDGCDYGDTYCSSCLDANWQCESCGYESFDEDNQRSTSQRILCESCYNDLERTCEHCDETWVEEDLPRMERLRPTDVLAVYCRECRRHHTECPDCDSAFDMNDCNDPTCDRCDDCYTDPDQPTPIIARCDTDTLPLPLTHTEDGQ
jgi:hypothetical protein